jgi:DNA-binding transcriptional ArsR family regulator
MAEQLIDVDKLEGMVNRVKTLNHPDRIGIIELLNKKERCSVMEIQSHMNLEQASTSNHLRLLKDAHIVISKRVGKNKFYSINRPILNEIISNVTRFTL